MTVMTNESVKDICARHSIHMISAIPVSENPHFNSTGLEGGNHHPDTYMRHFNCIAGLGDRSIQAHFSVGIGIIERWIQSGNLHDGSLTEAQRYSVRRGRATMDNESPRTSYWLAGFEQAAKYYTPPIHMFISALAMDCLTTIHGQDFSEWCHELGLDDDSISARKNFDQCCEMERKLRRFTGNDRLFDALLEAAGRE